MSGTKGKMKKGGFRLFVAMAVMMVAFAGLVTFQAFGADESDAADESYEASVVSNGVETKYTTLEGAFAAAQSGEKITLLKSVSDVGDIIITGGKELTFDLNNGTVHFDSRKNIKIDGGSLKIIGNGILSEKEGGADYAPIRLYGSTTSGTSDYTKLYVGSDVTLIGWSGIFITEKGINTGSSTVRDGVVVDFYGKINAVKDSNNDCDGGIYVNGLIKNVSSTSPIINIYPGSSIESAREGIYAAGYAQWNIYGGSIQGDTGIEMRAGVLNIYGGNIVATGSSTVVTPEDSDPTTVGAGVAIAQHTTKLDIQVTINGGSISGHTALNIADPQNNGVDAIAKIKVKVNGGTFACNNGGTESVNCSVSQITGFINGGTFSSDVSAYVASGVSIAQKGAIWYVGDDSSSGTTEAVVDGEVVVDNPESTTASFIVTETQSKATIKTSLSGISMTVNVTDLAQGSYEFVVEKVEKPVVGTNVIRVETPNVTISSIAISVPIEVPSGHYVSSVKAYYYNEATGEREYLSGVSYSGGMLSFSTNHNSYYGYEYTTSAVVYDDDDDYYPVVPVTPSSTSSKNSDNATTIVACAAAAVAAALAVAFFLVDSRRP